MKKNDLKNKRDIIHHMKKKINHCMVNNLGMNSNLSIKFVNNIIFNEQIRIVAIFKDHLIYDDDSEFLKRYYYLDESIVKIKKVCEFYDEFSKIFPNYTTLRESKFMYKNIKRKQKLIDNLQEKENLFSDEDYCAERLFDTENLKSIHNQSESCQNDKIEISTYKHEKSIINIEESTKSLEFLTNLIDSAEVMVDKNKLSCLKYLNKNYKKKNIILYSEDKTEQKNNIGKSVNKSKKLQNEVVQKDFRIKKNPYNFNLNLNAICNENKFNKPVELNKKSNEKVNSNTGNFSLKQSNNKIKETSLYNSKYKNDGMLTIDKFSSNLGLDQNTYLNSKMNTNQNLPSNNSLYNKNENLNTINDINRSKNKIKYINSERLHKKNDIKNLLINNGKIISNYNLSSNDKFIVFEENLNQRKKGLRDEIPNINSIVEKKLKRTQAASLVGPVYNINIINNYQNIILSNKSNNLTYNNPRKFDSTKKAKSHAKQRNTSILNSDKSIINKTMKLSTLIKSINEVKENRTIGYLHNPKKISFSTQRINNSKNHWVVKSKTPLPQASQFSKDYSKMSDFIAQEKDLKSTLLQGRSRKMMKQVLK